jgi:hypothetical protein
MSLQDLIVFHLRANGPVSLASIVQYVHLQHEEREDEDEIAEALTYLIRRYNVRLNADGTFDMDHRYKSQWF